MGTLRIVSILVLMMSLEILSSVESRDSSITHIPKYLNRAEAERVSAARWKLTQSLAAAPRIDNEMVLVNGDNIFFSEISAMEISFC